MSNKLALISVSDKTGLINLAQALIDLDYQIISTGGTFEVLSKNHIPAIPIEQITGFPEMLDGRVKTLNPKIFGGILAKREVKEHLQTCAEHHISLIDLVIVNLYPFEKVTANPDVTLEVAIENIDIGGPSLIRAAAKNYESVAVLVNPEKYSAIIAELKKGQGKLSLATKQTLAKEAYQHTSRYDALITNFLEKRFNQDARQSPFPTILTPVYHKLFDLRYGENPHQQAAFYQATADKIGLPHLNQLNGKELSYNNLVDLESAWHIVKEFEIPAATIIKHTNPCGTATGDTIEQAYQKAYAADPISAFGSIIGLNRNVDQQTADEISKTFVEAVIAPSYDNEAIQIFKQKAGLRVIQIPDFFITAADLQYKHLKGGLLIQTVNNVILTKEQLRVVTQKQPTIEEINDLIFAFGLVKHVKSNAIVVAKNGQSLGIGAGQMSRIDSVKIALEKTGTRAQGAVLASDAYFPFSDCIEYMAPLGISAVIQPGGSKRDKESIQAADTLGLAMVFTDVRYFMH